MNILFFLTPKQDVAFLYQDATIRQALEKMEHHRYSAIPIIDHDGRYVGTLTEGDLLWAIKGKYDMNLRSAEKHLVVDVPRRMDNLPVYATTTIDQLLGTSINQNFVPVVDDRGMFIGIVTRKSIMQYCYDQLRIVTVKEK